jgi:predicted PurR-regulated permease PerM
MVHAAGDPVSRKVRCGGHNSGAVANTGRDRVKPRIDASSTATDGRSLNNEEYRVRTIEDQSFLILLIAVSVAFGWILQPYFGSIVWGIVAAIVFAPFCNWLSGFLRWPSLAPLVTVLVTIALVIVPLIVIAAALGREATNLYRRIQSGEIDFVGNTQQILDTLPGWARDVLGWFGLTDLDTMRAALTTPLVKSSQYLATQALSFGSLTFDFIIGLCVMLYLLFFLLQDGDALAQRIRTAIPLQDGRKKALVTRFIAVIRATVKGGILVAMAQGALGGLAFWFLGIHSPVFWAVIMAFLSLVPAVGAALVWLPLAIYLLATGSIGQGIFLIAYGVLVIGLVDNILRPFLVGKDTKLPDYVVLISTLGGIEVFGLQGFVIGPLIAAMFVVTWEIFAASRQDAA